MIHDDKIKISVADSNIQFYFGDDFDTVYVGDKDCVLQNFYHFVTIQIVNFDCDASDWASVAALNMT